jgi:hypothetical protein
MSDLLRHPPPFSVLCLSPMRAALSEGPESVLKRFLRMCDDLGPCCVCDVRRSPAGWACAPTSCARSSTACSRRVRKQYGYISCNVNNTDGLITSMELAGWLLDAMGRAGTSGHRGCTSG